MYSIRTSWPGSCTARPTHAGRHRLGVFRYDVRRARVPRIPLSEQRRYGAAFRRLAEFAALMRRAANLAMMWYGCPTHGLTSRIRAAR